MIKSKKVLLMCCLTACLMVVGVVEIFAESEEGNINLRKLNEEVVLYTIHRGSYDKIGTSIGSLYALAGTKGISPRGSAYYVYLNNPNQLPSQHWLTEIRIPVSSDALKIAGTLGEMTDIKMLPSVEVAVAIKPEGQTDPKLIYDRLYKWIIKKGYIPADSAREMFLTNAMGSDYTKMKTEIMIPIQKLSADTH